jgi:hypothetical protein
MELKEVFADIALDRPEIVDLVDANGLRLRLRSHDSPLIVATFGGYQAFRKRDESFAGKTIDILVGSIRPENRFHWLYELHESEFLDWFEDESLGIVAGPDLRHYMIVTANDIVDVISTEPPSISAED